MKITMRHLGVALLFVAAGCTPILIHQLDQKYGKADPSRYAQPHAPLRGEPEYWRDVRPVLEQRCTVCHGCYDAPCQQNLTSRDGIVRGANPDVVYSLRLLPAEPSRLFIDAQTPAEWRERKFHPVLNERVNTPEANLEGSVMYRLLDLKRQHPLPESTVLDDQTFTFSLDRKQSCPAIETMDKFEQEHPQWGMPYGLPGLSKKEFSVIERWLAAGAPSLKTPALPVEVLTQIEAWESFFNGRSLKQQLMSRYIYEHLFLGHLYFKSVPMQEGERPVFFRLVRSTTPPGEPISEITSRRPYEDPRVSQFWYRLRHDEGSVVEKTHMPYALDAARMQRWKQLFLDAAYTVNTLPSYDPEISGNPFVVFKDLPVDSRYRFMLDESQFAIDNFIKGPVCRGQVALGVIDDHFWVFFLDPDLIDKEATAEFLARESDNLRLPNESEGNVRVAQWFMYQSMQKKYLKAKSEQGAKALVNSKLTEQAIWDGDGGDNAALTVFRHTDSASVIKGLVGQPPKTAWVMGYPLLERIHYLLVAGFDVYGGLGHQMNTRLYMDFMRMEGEANFIDFLPKESRLGVRDHWYREASEDAKNFVYGDQFKLDMETGIEYKTHDYQQELYTLFARRIGINYTDVTLPKFIKPLQAIRGESLSWFPQNSILRVDRPSGGSEYFTLINNSGYSNNSELFGDAKRRLPAEDYLTVVPGIVGAYPNAFFRVDSMQAVAFTNQLAAIASAAEYAAFMDEYGVRRTSPKFWAFSDALHDYYRQAEPITSGMLDYNRLENR